LALLLRAHTLARPCFSVTNYEKCPFLKSWPNRSFFEVGPLAWPQMKGEWRFWAKKWSLDTDQEFYILLFLRPKMRLGQGCQIFTW
jgi:hypothetical protein